MPYTYNMTFDWDETKRESNLAKHHIDFALAALVFLDMDRIERVDDRKDYGETRYQVIGQTKGILLFVVYTKRSDVIRIISARRANKNEEKYYLQH